MQSAGQNRDERAISPTVRCRAYFVPLPAPAVVIVTIVTPHRLERRAEPAKHAANRAYQPAIGSSRLAGAASPSLSASPSLCDGESGFRSRLYCRGEQPMTLLKAVLKALSDS